ncbi:MAG: lysylphosphatidylglycerol synthase transmembrane domain-containing protein [Actinomycetota bacterium]
MAPDLRRVAADVWGRRPIQILVATVVVAVVFVFAIPRFAPYRSVWDELRGLTPSALVPLAVVAAANLVAPALSFRAALPGLRLGPALAMDWATTAVTNLVPAGSALAIGLTWSMLRSFGLERNPIARAIVVTGILDALVKLGLPLLAIGWLALVQPVGPGLVQAAVIGAVLFICAVWLSTVILAGPSAADIGGRLLDRLPMIGDGWTPRLHGIRQDTVALLGARWRSMIGWTLFGHANLYLLLVICLRAVDIPRTELGLASILAAFAFGRLITALPITPGGLGVMEVGLIGALGAVGDAPEASVVAAVLAFRFCNFVLPLPLGAGAGWWWRRAGRTVQTRAA